MNLDDFSTVVDDRRYVNPQVSLDEQNTFIDNLRSAQGARTAEIAQDTYNLGTSVPSNLGGLSGAGSYFTSRYQTPQTNELIANLRTAAQAQALSDAMNNKIAQAKERYNKAYKAAQKRANTPRTVGPAEPGDDFNENPTGDGQTVGEKETVKQFGFYKDSSGKPRYGTLKDDYQLLDAGQKGTVWEIQNVFPSGAILKEGSQYTDNSGVTYIYTNGKIYRMWRGAPYK